MRLFCPRLIRLYGMYVFGVGGEASCGSENPQIVLHHLTRVCAKTLGGIEDGAGSSQIARGGSMDLASRMVV